MLMRSHGRERKESSRTSSVMYGRERMKEIWVKALSWEGILGE